MTHAGFHILFYALVAAANPLAIAQTRISGGEQAVALVLSVVLGSLTILAPVAIYGIAGLST